MFTEQIHMPKMSSPKFRFLFLLVLGGVSSRNLPKRHEYQDLRTEKPNEKYSVEWQTDFDEKSIEFLIEVETSGFVGFGISRSGNLNGADIFVGGVIVSNESIYYNDYHGSADGRLLKDTENNWEVVSAVETANVTTLHLKRLLITCDDLHDIDINSGTIRMFWAIGEKDDVILEKSEYGFLPINFLDPSIPMLDYSTFETFNFTMNVALTGEVTELFWSIQKRNSERKSHIVAFRPKFDTPLALKHTYYINIYLCKVSNGKNGDEIFGKYLSQSPLNSRAETVPFELLQYCSDVLYAWSLGGRMMAFPEEVGYPWGSSNNEYFLVQSHVDNADRIKDMQFETGITVYYTKQPRMKEAGLFTVFQDQWSLFIPPETKNWTVVGHCSSNCLKNILPEKGITLINVNLHGHSLSRKMKLRHFRGNNELPWVIKDDSYDFKYQENRPLRKGIHVHRGDQLSLECTYNSVRGGTRSAGVVGGDSWNEEMCMAFLYYYPKVNLNSCGSEFQKDKILNFQDDFEDADVTMWTDTLRKELQIYSLRSAHLEKCYPSADASNKNTTVYPKVTHKYHPHLITSCPVTIPQ